MKSLKCKLSSLLVLFSLICLPSQAQSNSASGPVVTANARSIHDSAIIIDTHADTPQRFVDDDFDIGSSDPGDVGHISLAKAKAGNLGAEFFSIWVDPDTSKGRFVERTLDLIDSVYQQAARHPDQIMMAFSA